MFVYLGEEWWGGGGLVQSLFFPPVYSSQSLSLIAIILIFAANIYLMVGLLVSRIFGFLFTRIYWYFRSFRSRLLFYLFIYLSLFHKNLLTISVFLSISTLFNLFYYFFILFFFLHALEPINIFRFLLHYFFFSQLTNAALRLRTRSHRKRSQCKTLTSHPQLK